MKLFSSLVAIVIVLCLAAGAFLVFGGARADVVKDTILKKADALLGELDVRRKEVTRAMKDMGSGIDELAKGRIEAQVKAERLDSQVKESEDGIAEADKALVKLRDALTSAVAVEIAGKSYSQEQLKSMAERVLQARKTLSLELESRRRTKTRLEKIASTLEGREQAALTKLARLKGQMRDISTELLALNSYKAAAAVAGNADATFGQNFEELERKVNELQDRVKVETRREEEKWNILDARKEIDAATIVNVMTTPDEIVAEINKVVPKK